MRRLNISRRLILPAAGVVIFLAAFLAQNVWEVFHVNDISRTIRDLNQAGVLIAMFALGLVEGTILLCFYLPGTAVVIVLLLGLQPSWAEAVPLVLALMAGTVAGYGLSLLLGQVLQQRLPALVGETYFRKVQSLIERFGLWSFIPIAMHPNQLALAFSILGYFRIRRLSRFFAVGTLVQAGWWAIYGSAAGLIAGQNLVTSDNFQLYVATLFFLWFLYELVSKPKPVNIP